MADEASEQASPPPAPLTPEEYLFQREKYIAWADTQLARLHERHTLSGQEFDKQIVALAGGGLALTLTLAKDVFDKEGAHLIWLAYLSWACFLVALTVNLLSHQTAADHYNAMMDRMGLLRTASVTRSAPDMNAHSELTNRINVLTPKLRRMNAWAWRTTLAGITLFVIFIAYNHYTQNGQKSAKPPAATAANRPRPHQGVVRNRLAPQSGIASDSATNASAASIPDSASSASERIEYTTMRKPELAQPERRKVVAAKGCITATSEMTNPGMPPTPPPPPPAKKKN